VLTVLECPTKTKKSGDDDLPVPPLPAARSLRTFPMQLEWKCRSQVLDKPLASQLPPWLIILSASNAPVLRTRSQKVRPRLEHRSPIQFAAVSWLAKA
jgi:hypothetical protein